MNELPAAPFQLGRSLVQPPGSCAGSAKLAFWIVTDSAAADVTKQSTTKKVVVIRIKSFLMKFSNQSRDKQKTPDTQLRAPPRAKREACRKIENQAFFVSVSRSCLRNNKLAISAS